MDKANILDRAIKLAATEHQGQFDKSGMPYILHPLKVMYYLKTDDLELMAIAVLHDVVEDTHITFFDLEHTYGMTPRILSALRLLTKQKGQTYDDYKEVIKTSRDAMLVKLADLRHNSDIRRLKGVTEKDIKRIEKYHNFYLELKGLV
jgi:(p)ppGpp synthase/HD superfamily hydrolase